MLQFLSEVSQRLIYHGNGRRRFMSDIQKMMEKRKNTRMWYISMVTSVAAGLVLVGLLIALGRMDNVNVWQGRTEEGYTRILDYTCRDIENGDAPIGIIKEYTFSLCGTLERDTCLAFYTVHQYVDVWLDGELVYSLSRSNDNHITRTVGSNWVMIPLYREDAGKEIRIDITPVYESFRNRKVDFLIGSQMKIYRDRLFRDFPQLILSILSIFLGFAIMCVAGYSQFKRHRGRSLFALGLFSVMLGLWRVSDTRFTPFLLPDKPVLLFYISVSMLMIGMVPLIKSMEERFHWKSRRLLDGYCIGTALICLLQLLLQIFGVLDLRDGLFITHIVIAVGGFWVIGNVIYERIRYPRQRTFLVGEKLPLICVVGALADAAAFYIKGNSSGLMFSLLAFLFYVVFMGIATIFNYTEQEKQLAEKDRQLAENERKLTENRIATMMSQIKPHFIFNTLGTIGQLCLDEPEKAADLVQKFSLYLRGNFTELDNSSLISVSQELEHVQHYVNIEQIRFPDIQVQYDIQAAEFLLPPLTIQPLVENAIKHGLMGLESGGTVVISTYESDEAYCVSVRDDGVGFDETAPSDGKKHIGINNIRGRVEAMCRGKLIIESTVGVGTVARIEIPREGEKEW